MNKQILNKGISTPIGILIIVLTAIIAGAGIFAYQYYWMPEEKYVETPPLVKDETADWETYRNEEYGFEFKYPEDLGKDYIGAHQWPPRVTVEQINTNFICEGSQITLDDSEYCVLTEGGAALGTAYTTYRYITNKNDKQLTFEFVLKFPNCGNYGIDSKMKECEKEQKDFNSTMLIDKMLSTFRFLE